MTKIRLLAQTDKTVTLRRADFQALLEAAEDNADLAAVEKHRAEEQRLGWDVAKRNYLTRDEAERVLNKERPVRIWREKRGGKQRALAEAAQVPVSYLAEIEGGKKPGSTGALQSLAEILEVPMEILAGDRFDGHKPTFRPVTRAELAAARLDKLARESGDRNRLSDDARAVVAEWIEFAERDGVRHRLKFAVGTLESLILGKATEWARHADDADRLGNKTAAKKAKRVSDALEAAWDALGIEYDKL